jgi:hypothetical protein
LWRCEQAGDAVAQTLRALPKLETLDLAKSGLTDAGLAELGGLPALRNLYLGESKVTREAVARFRKAHPEVEVSWTEPAWEIERRKNLAP